MTKKIKKVDDFINNELREYALYDNERSIPSVVDGLKTSQRKVIYTVFETLKSKVPIKTASLGAKASDLTHYKHGENSIIDTVITLAKDYAGSNNYPLLLKDGQFGNVIDNGNSSPRYIFVMRYDKLDEMFDKEDREIIEYLKFDGCSIEPRFYLPKLPLVLINGSTGIGNGYSCNILTRDVSSVAKYLNNKITNKKSKVDFLLPSFNGFTGQVIRLSDTSYEVHGVIERVNTTQTIIKDLPPSSRYQYDKYKERVLLPLILDNKVGVTDFINESTESGWHIIIKHTREFGNCTDEELLQKLKLVEKVTENITVWDYDNKLRVFNSAYDLIDYWFDERIKWIETRKSHKLSKLKDRVDWYNSLLKLIEYWLENDLSKLPKNELTSRLSNVCDNIEYINKFLDQNIMSLTFDRVNKLKSDIKLIIDEYSELEKMTSNDIFAVDITPFK